MPGSGLVGDCSVRAIAFYLPQYHPIPENDAWWGKGFTEWTSVAQARPRFRGHYQPHIPGELGFYDLRLPEVREAQADLAAAHGVHGFCYYHYWFAGRRLLDRPFREVLASGEPDYPFCLCWANENWTRRWDGLEQEVLLAQQYSVEDDVAHIRSLLPAFEDERYIRVDGRPLFLVYRTQALPDPARTAEIWRREARRAGIEDLYLVRVEQHGEGVTPEAVGFDAAVEFLPDASVCGGARFHGRRFAPLTRTGLLPRAYAENRVLDYRMLIRGALSKPIARYTRFRCLAPSWDNSARRQTNAIIYQGSTPELYGKWAKRVVRSTMDCLDGDERLLFINAWNEWGEGCHLEPDLRHGRAYLEATRDALALAERLSREIERAV